MKTSHFLSLVALSASSLAQAEWYYYWNGNADQTDYADNTYWLAGQTEGFENATANNWYPNGGSDVVSIGAQGAKSGDLLWDGNQGWNVGVLYIDNDSTLTMTGWGDFDMGRVYIGTGSSLILNQPGDVGGFTSSVIDMTGKMAQGDDPRLSLNIGKFWGGNEGEKLLTLTGELDLSGLSGSGKLTLATINITPYSGTLGYDITGLTSADGQFKAEWEGEGNSRSVVMYYDLPEQSVPEPTSTTLSLLALAGLAARRRRK